MTMTLVNCCRHIPFLWLFPPFRILTFSRTHTIAVVEPRTKYYMSTSSAWVFAICIFCKDSVIVLSIFLCNCLAIGKVAARVANRKAKVNIGSGCAFLAKRREEDIDYNCAFLHLQSIWNWRATTFRRNAETRKTVMSCKLPKKSSVRIQFNPILMCFSCGFVNRIEPTNQETDRQTSQL